MREGVSDRSAIFEPLQLGTLTVKNRIVRSSISGRFDNYDGSGTETRINWDVKFARGGVGAIISSNAPIHVRGRIVPGYASIEHDGRIPFWRELGKRIHEHDCKYILQIVYSGRNREIGGIEYAKGLSSTDKPDPLHGFETERATIPQIKEIVALFAAAGRRAREAGLDGIELAGANGILFTQFLSSGINGRKDQYGGSLENRARFAIEVVRAIREEVGDFPLGFKISMREHMKEVFPWLPDGNTLAESVQVCKWLEEAGVDYIHISSGGLFPHPRNPAGKMPMKELTKSYDTMLSSGRYTLRNYFVFRTPVISSLYARWWEKPQRDQGGPEGINLADSRAAKRAVSIPVLCTGGFQTASFIARAITNGDCDGVTIARPLVANPDLVRHFEQGRDRAPRPCTYCNKCLVNFVENPLGCYEERRFDSREEMIRQIMSVYEPRSFFETEAQPLEEVR